MIKDIIIHETTRTPDSWDENGRADTSGLPRIVR